MAYRRKPQYRRKRRYVKKAKSSWASKALGAVSGIGLRILKNKLGLNTETKYMDTIQGPTTVSTTALHTTYALAIPQGTTTNQRTGAGVRITSYHVKGKLYPSAGDINSNFVRVVYYTRKILNGITSATGDILQLNTNTLSPYNMNTESYSIIYDKTFSMGPYGTTSTNSGQHCFEFNYTPTDHQLHWTAADTTGNIGNVEKGLIRGFVMCDSQAPVFENYTRVKFVDN